MPLILLLGGGLLLLLASKPSPAAAPTPPAPTGPGGGPMIDAQGFVVFQRFMPADIAALSAGVALLLQDSAARVWTLTLIAPASFNNANVPASSGWFQGTVVSVSPPPPNGAPVGTTMQFTAGEVSAIAKTPGQWQIAP
jgi:hypothetical protein